MGTHRWWVNNGRGISCHLWLNYFICMLRHAISLSPRSRRCIFDIDSWKYISNFICECTATKQKNKLVHCRLLFLRYIQKEARLFILNQFSSCYTDTRRNSGLKKFFNTFSSPFYWLHSDSDTGKHFFSLNLRYVYIFTIFTQPYFIFRFLVTNTIARKRLYRTLPNSY